MKGSFLARKPFRPVGRLVGWLVPILVSLFILSCGDPLSDPEVQKQRESVPDQFRPGFDQYVVNNCQACHGLRGGGDGPLNKSRRFDTPNFRQADSYRHGSSIAEILNSIEFGVNGGRTGMQAYQNIGPDNLTAIAQYIRWLQQ